VTFGQLVAFTRQSFPERPDWPLARNASIIRQLWKRYGPSEVEVMVKGAALLGWKDLRGLYSKEGIGRRWAQTAYWNRTKRSGPTLEQIGDLMRKANIT